MRLMEFVTDEDVLRHPTNWVEIPKERALSTCWFELVVALYTVGHHKHVELFSTHGGMPTSTAWIANGFFAGDHDRTVKFYIRKKLNKQAFADYMDAHAGKESQHACAHYVQLGLQAGGFDTSDRPANTKYSHDWARLYGPFLRKLGADSISSDGYSHKKGQVGKEQIGDIVVIQPVEGHNEAGHIAMWDGSQWVSDFFQQHLSPYHGVDETGLDFVIYRF